MHCLLDWYNCPFNEYSASKNYMNHLNRIEKKKQGTRWLYWSRLGRSHIIFLWETLFVKNQCINYI